VHRFAAMAVAATALAVAGVAYAASQFDVRPGEFDPDHTFLVQAAWLGGIGCPTTETFTDTACPTGDSKDKRVEGLLLAKTGSTANNASAFAVITDPPRTLTELGWDIRKPGNELSAGARGSHCGAGAPRWNITTRDGTTYFIGCNSPPAADQTPGEGFVRLRWGAGTLAVQAGTGTPTPINTLDVRRLSIVFDEGYDTGPDNFGLAVLDNINVNGVLVGQGRGNNGNNDGDDNDDDD
jgi:hypothetical protein